MEEGAPGLEFEILLGPEILAGPDLEAMRDAGGADEIAVFTEDDGGADTLRVSLVVMPKARLGDVAVAACFDGESGAAVAGEGDDGSILGDGRRGVDEARGPPRIAARPGSCPGLRRRSRPAPGPRPRAGLSPASPSGACNTVKPSNSNLVA